MIKRYIVAPDFSTGPPPQGPVHLGSILRSVFEYVPLNDGQIPDIPKRLPADRKKGFQMTRGELLKGHAGVFGKALAIFGVGVGASAMFSKDRDDVLTVKNLETIAFNPTDEYIRQSMDTDGVIIYTDATKYKKPVFLITGMKIARGASFKGKGSTTASGELQLGFHGPGGMGKTGVGAGIEKGKFAEESFEESSDFILAIRVRKLSFKKADVVHSEHNHGATMMDGLADQRYTLEIEDGGEEFEILDRRFPLGTIELREEDGQTEREYIVIPADQTNVSE